MSLLPSVPENLQNIPVVREYLLQLVAAIDAAVGTGSSATLAAAEAYTDSLEALDVRLDGSRPMTGPLNMNLHKILNVSDPTSNTDAANKEYVDASTGSGVNPGFDVASIYKTNGVSTLNPVDGTTINFTTGRDGLSFFSATGVFAGLSGLIATDLAIYVDGVLLVHSDALFINGSGGDRSGPVTQEPCGSKFLTAGPHTAHLVAGQVNIALQASAGDPLTLTVIYPTLTGPITAASPITTQQIENTTGTPTTSTNQTYVTVPGTHIDLVLPGTQTVVFQAQGSILPSTTPDGNGFNGQLGIKVDGVNYDGPVTSWDSIYTHVAAPVTVYKALVLGAGAHTVDVVFRAAAGSREGRLANAAGKATRLTALYTVPEVIAPSAAAAFTSQTASNTTGTITTAASTTYVLVPNTLITIILPGSQTVFFDGFATAFANLGQDIDAQLGLRIDGVDYNGTAAGASTTLVSSNRPITAGMAIVLGAGAHTAQLILRQSVDAVGTNARIRNTTDDPTVLTAIYTVPQTVPPSDMAFVEAIATGGQFDTSSATFVDVTGTTLNFSLTDPKNVTIKAQFTGIRDFADTDITALYALKIDGTDYKMGGLKLSLAGGFNGFWVQSFEKTIALGVGPHIAVLRLKSDGTHNSHIASDTDKPTIITAQYVA